jgi:Na+-translocating ferredoxin:NAD+ oxidoreductase RnfA subunit
MTSVNDGVSTSDALYHGIGLTFLTICPLLGASVYFFGGGSKLWGRILSGYAGGMLLGFALMHALRDGVDGIVSDYPYPFMIAGTTTIFLVSDMVTLTFIHLSYQSLTIR